MPASLWKRHDTSWGATGYFKTELFFPALLFCFLYCDYRIFVVVIVVILGFFLGGGCEIKKNHGV